MRAALYARFSTERQRDASIEDQFRECERVAKAAGLEVVARFEDRGISAGTTARPGYRALLEAARRRVFDVIVTEDISRLWRNRAEFGPRSAELEDLGVDCLTCVGDDTRRDGWGLVIQIKHRLSRLWQSMRAEGSCLRPLARDVVFHASTVILMFDGSTPSARRGYVHPSRSTAESPSICHTSCHTASAGVGNESVSG
jgi:hypothetical protein